MRRTDLGNRPPTRSFTLSWSRRAAHPLTWQSVRLAKAQYFGGEDSEPTITRGQELRLGPRSVRTGQIRKCRKQLGLSALCRQSCAVSCAGAHDMPTYFNL